VLILIASIHGIIFTRYDHGSVVTYIVYAGHEYDFYIHPGNDMAMSHSPIVCRQAKELRQEAEVLCYQDKVSLVLLLVKFPSCSQV
jgi:hypothetical protein